MKIVVDTNVILSSLLGSALSTSKRLLATIQSAHILVISLAMAAEIGVVIMRPKFSRLGTEKERVINIQALLSAPHIMAIVLTFTIVHPDLLDMDDNRILEVAVAANTDLIITGDKQLLALRGISTHIVESLAEPPADDSSIPIMSPSEALDYLLSI